MNRNQRYDERQIQARGKAYQYGFFAAIGTFVLLYLLQEVWEVSVAGQAVLLGGIWIPLTVCLIAMIVQDSYDYVNSTAGRISLTVFGLVGAGLLGGAVYQAAFLGKGVFLGRTLTEQAGWLLTGGCMVLICLIYWGKQVYNRKRFAEE